jgi:hypothetical protein
VGAEKQQQTLTNTCQRKEKAKGIWVAERLVGRRKGPVYVFGDAGKEMKETGTTTLQRAREIGLEAELKCVYVDSEPDDGIRDTTCPECGCVVPRIMASRSPIVFGTDAAWIAERPSPALRWEVDRWINKLLRSWRRWHGSWKPSRQT